VVVMQLVGSHPVMAFISTVIVSVFITLSDILRRVQNFLSKMLTPERKKTEHEFTRTWLSRPRWHNYLFICLLCKSYV